MANQPIRRSLWKSVILVLSLFVAIVPPPAGAGHDVPEDDPNYFLPMPPDRAMELLDIGEHLQFIDLRDPAEFKRERLPGAISIPLNDLPAQFEKKVPHSGRVVLYCGTCAPEEQGGSFRFLRDQGYRNVTVLPGGITEWRRLGYPIETDPR